MRCPRHGWMPVLTRSSTLSGVSSSPLPPPEVVISQLCALVVSPARFCGDAWAIGVLVLELVCGLYSEDPTKQQLNDELRLHNVRAWGCACECLCACSRVRPARRSRLLWVCHPEKTFGMRQRNKLACFSPSYPMWCARRTPCLPPVLSPYIDFHGGVSLLWPVKLVSLANSVYSLSISALF